MHPVSYLIEILTLGAFITTQVYNIQSSDMTTTKVKRAISRTALLIIGKISKNPTPKIIATSDIDNNHHAIFESTTCFWNVKYMDDAEHMMFV